MRKVTILAVLAALVAGCSSSRLMMDQGYQERPKLSESLFKGDQDYVSEEAVQRILSSKIHLPPRSKIAIFRFEGGEEERFALTYYGYSYWRTEAYIKAQQQLVDALQSSLLSSGRVSEATPLPSMLVPPQPSITMLRQAAVRLQADLLLVFRVTSDVYYDYNLFRQDRIKAYSTCEALLFDVRTGIIPFTTIISRDVLKVRTQKEINSGEARRIAEQEASMSAVTDVGIELAQFLKSIGQ